MAGADISKNEKDTLQKNFLLISETRSILEGVDAFVYWCNQRNLPIKKTIQEFIQAKKKYESYYDDNGFINGE